MRNKAAELETGMEELLKEPLAKLLGRQASWTFAAGVSLAMVCEGMMLLKQARELPITPLVATVGVLALRVGLNSISLCNQAGLLAEDMCELRKERRLRHMKIFCATLIIGMHAGEGYMLARTALKKVEGVLIKAPTQTRAWKNPELVDPELAK